MSEKSSAGDAFAGDFAAVPKLSIIIPTFNSAGTIERCLKSIAVQTFMDYEVIVQDGSPNDDTARTIERFQQTHSNFAIRLYRERDHGIYDAMNKGMVRARGEWLYFLGGDDELFDSRVFATVLTATNTDQCDVIYGNAQIIGDCGWAKSGAMYDGPFDLAKLLNRNICHQAIFYRADFARRIGDFQTDYAVCADWDFNMRCWARSRFRYADIAVTKFYAGGHSSRDPSDERFNRDFATNVLNYFRLYLLSPLVNTPSFAGLSQIIGMQKEKGKLHSFCGRAVRRFLRSRM